MGEIVIRGSGCERVLDWQVENLPLGGYFKAESVYNNKNLANHHANVVLVGEQVFGFGEGRGLGLPRVHDR